MPKILPHEFPSQRSPKEDRSKTGFVGWLRTGRGKRWRDVVYAPTERECLQLLLAYSRGKSGDMIVLRRGEDANEGRG